jgi:hypothetical protein
MRNERKAVKNLWMIILPFLLKIWH